MVGVLGPGFRGLERGVVNDVWISLDTWSRFYGSPASLERRDARNFEVVARLAPGATLGRASSDLTLVGSRWATAFPGASRGRTVHVQWATGIAGRVDPLAMVLGAGVLLVLVIAGANASTLLAGLADARRAEMGMRQALGASRSRIVRQVLAEAALLALAGAGAGLALAEALVRAAPAVLPPSPLAVDYAVRLDGRALVVAGILALLATAAGGLVPALRASRIEVAPSLRVTAEALAPRRLLALPTALVALQVTLAVVTLNTAGLLLGSFAATRSASRGFDTDRRILVLQLAMGDEVG
ncbi:MAG TPA: FtsX-like permease family protein, partial [Vicinamibacteria bacterium]|nr:FtsX-like permease family protein [Vicinamibacteria bacterium]